MSTTIIPDIYRHIARKSTVSRNVKPPSKPVPLCDPKFPMNDNNNNSPKEEQSIFDTIQCDIKFENDILQEQDQQNQSFILIPDNEIEQMNIEQTNDEIIFDIIEQIKNQIPEYSNNQIQNSNIRRTISTDIHGIMNSLITHIDENDHEQSFHTPTNDSTSTTNDVQIDDDISMDTSQQSSINSRIQNDDDIVEVQVSPPNIQSPLCTCQCHQSTSNNPTNEYLLFEQALRQTRQEQQHQETLLNNNQLIQTLKQQHQDLLTLYHKQINMNKTDREQQTIQIKQHDSQIQTDLASILSSQQLNHKPPIHQVNGIHSTSNAKVPTAPPIPRPFNSFLTPIRTTGPSLQQLIPCLSTTTTATTTTLTNKTTTTIIKKAPVVPIISPQPVSSPSGSQDIVDLTEDDDDTNVNKLSGKKISPVKTQKSSTTPPIAVTNRIQPTNRPVRPNPTASLSPTFPLRPLPEHNPCDQTIARPQLNITHDNTTVRLTWNLPSTSMESIQNYEIYAYKQNSTVTTSDWKRIGVVNSMRLPMAVTLKEFQSNSHYAFAVRAVAINNNVGPFCEPKTIFTGNTLTQSSNNTNHIGDT